MTKLPNWFSIFTIALIVMILSPACIPKEGVAPKKVCFHNRCFDVEVAQTQEEKAKGLQFRESLGKNNGMLFIFSESKRHSFWMKNTLIPLDIVWLDGNKRIATIIRDVLPCKTEQCPTYRPQREALYVLEVNAGVTIELGLKVGDQAIF